MPYGTRNRRWWSPITSLACAALLIAPLLGATVAARGPDSLQQAVAGQARAAVIGDSVVGIHIVDLATGDVLANYDNSSGGGFLPASNMKLVTSGAALHVLGPEFRFRTEVRREDNTIIIVGGGDPGFADPVLLEEMAPAMSVEKILDTLADYIAKDGLTRVSEIIVDDRIFDREYAHSSWPADQLNEPYCAEVNGINFHLNTTRVFASPSRELGSLASIKLEPDTDVLNLDVLVRTTGQAGTQSIWITRVPDTNEIKVGGYVRINASAEVTVHDTATWFGHMLLDHMAKRGISRADRAEIRLATENEALPTGELIVPIVTPMARALKRCNTDSQNLYAESMLKRLGAASGEPGSWSNGAAMVQMVVRQRLGSTYSGSLVMADGSGLSRLNRVTPQFMTAWLGSMYDDPKLSDMFVESLATPGSGTLRRRFSDRPTNQVRVKTGFINGVRTMSGYVIDNRGGRAVAFSVLVNDLGVSAEHQAAKKLQERVVHLIDDWIGQQSVVSAERFGG